MARPATAWSAPGGRAVPRRRPSVEGVELDSESVLFDERTGMLHFLNSSASTVWWSIDGVVSADALAADLARRFDASPQLMRDDVVGLLKLFEAQGLIVATGSGAPGSHRD
jgi:PqqD family protein of HPr-rel-A system